MFIIIVTIIVSCIKTDMIIWGRPEKQRGQQGEDVEGAVAHVGDLGSLVFSLSLVFVYALLVLVLV